MFKLIKQIKGQSKKTDYKKPVFFTDENLSFEEEDKKYEKYFEMKNSIESTKKLIEYVIKEYNVTKNDIALGGSLGMAALMICGEYTNSEGIDKKVPQEVIKLYMEYITGKSQRKVSDLDFILMNSKNLSDTKLKTRIINVVNDIIKKPKIEEHKAQNFSLNDEIEKVEKKYKDFPNEVLNALGSKSKNPHKNVKIDFIRGKEKEKFVKLNLDGKIIYTNDMKEFFVNKFVYYLLNREKNITKYDGDIEVFYKMATKMYTLEELSDEIVYYSNENKNKINLADEISDFHRKENLKEPNKNKKNENVKTIFRWINKSDLKINNGSDIVKKKKTREYMELLKSDIRSRRQTFEYTEDKTAKTDISDIKISNEVVM